MKRAWKERVKPFQACLREPSHRREVQGKPSAIDLDQLGCNGFSDRFSWQKQCKYWKKPKTCGHGTKHDHLTIVNTSAFRLNLQTKASPAPQLSVCLADVQDSAQWDLLNQATEDTHMTWSDQERGPSWQLHPVHAGNAGPQTVFFHRWQARKETFQRSTYQLLCCRQRHLWQLRALDSLVSLLKS